MPSVQWVDIANRALARVGYQMISRLDEGSNAANYCSSLLPDALNEVYSAHPFGCAVRRVVLSPDTQRPAFGYAYAYPLPGDCARVLSVETLGEYAIESGCIVTDMDNCQICYIAIPQTPNDTSPQMIKLITEQLAYLICMPLTRNESLTARLLSDYSQDYALAVKYDTYGAYQSDTSTEWYTDNR